MTKPHAGNTGRHEDSILWDRLRADLANLGASYGEMPTTIQEPHDLEFFDMPGKPQWYCHKCGSKYDSEPTQGECQPDWAWREMLRLRGKQEPKQPEPATSQRRGSEVVDKYSEPDRNLYYDGIILAARKKREEFNWAAYYHQFDNDPGQSRERMLKCLAAGKEQEQSASLSDAMSRPLSFPKRIGWKPGECGE